MEIIDCNLEDERKDFIIKIIKDSFKQTDKNKTSYVRDQLKAFYSNEFWDVFYIYNKYTFSHSTTNNGGKLDCKYKDYRIRIFSYKKNTKESNQNDNFKQLESLNKEIFNLKLKLNEAEKELKKYQLSIFNKDKVIGNLKN